MGPEQILSLQIKVNLGVIAMKMYSTFPKALGQELNDQMQFIVIPRTLIGSGGGSHYSSEMQSAYSTASGDRTVW